VSRLLLEGGKGHRTEDTEVFGWVKIIARQGQACRPRLGRNLASTERGSGSLANYSEPHTARSSFAGLKPQSVPLSRLRNPSRFSPRHPKILRVLREMPFRHSRRQSEPHRLQRNTRIRGQHLIQYRPACFIHALEGMKINRHNLRGTSFEQSRDGAVQPFPRWRRR
jgi:hypothetical protein